MASKLADLLIHSGDLQSDQLESARGEQRLHGGRLEHILIERQMIPEKTLVAAIARVTGLPVAALDKIQAEGTALARLPVTFAWDMVCFPVHYDEGSRNLRVAVTDPTDLALVDEIIQRSNCRVKPLVAGAAEIHRAIRRHYRGEYVPDDEGSMALSGGSELGGGEEEEEFKITDISGKTVMTSLQALKDKHEADLAAKAAAAGAGAQAGQGLPPPPVAAPSARQTPLEDLTGGLFDIRALGPKERARAEKVCANVEKSGIILRTLLELLEENGVLWPGERDTL